MAVCSSDPPSGASAQRRLVQPLRSAGPDIELAWAVRIAAVQAEVAMEVIERADLVVLTGLFPHPRTAGFLEHLFRGGTPVLYEVDQLITEVPLTNPLHPLAEESRAMVVSCLHQARAVAVPCRELATAMSVHNPNVYVLPDSIDPGLFRAAVAERGEVFTIAYVGGPGDESDLACIEPDLIEVLARYGDRVRLLLMGCSTPRLASLPQARLVGFEADYGRYAARLRGAGIHLALAPLAPTLFNRCRSGVRWLECSAAGIPGIYADLEPYRECVRDGVTGRLVGAEPGRWRDSICEWIEDEATRLSVAQKAQAEVLGSHTVEQAATRWLEAYRRIASRGGLEVRPRPLCSVVIPVYNRAELTRQCLDALVGLEERTPHELIVVDNASSDETAELLRSHPAAPRVLRNDTNLGFARACNQGARAARGEWLVFLNNDTIPGPRWLDALVEAAIEVEGVGIVGSRLLYASGAIQHAGVALCTSTCRPYHAYSGAPGDDPAVLHRRELLVVTGACMLVRSSLFRELSGFDEGYRNGFEDVDLCLRAVARGTRVLYEPESVLIHLESQTPGRSRYERENAARLMARFGAAHLSDEARFYFAEGLVRRVTPVNEHQVWVQLQRLEPSDRQRFAVVAQLQGRLPREGARALRSLLEDPAQWPADPPILAWGARVCREGGLPELAMRFEDRAHACAAAPGGWTMPQAVRAQLSLV